MSPFPHAEPFQVGEVNIHRRLEHAMRFRIGVGDEDVALHADHDPAGKLRLRLCRRAAFRQSIA